MMAVVAASIYLQVSILGTGGDRRGGFNGIGPMNFELRDGRISALRIS